MISAKIKYDICGAIIFGICISFGFSSLLLQDKQFNIWRPLIRRYLSSFGSFYHFNHFSRIHFSIKTIKSFCAHLYCPICKMIKMYMIKLAIVYHKRIIMKYSLKHIKCTLRKSNIRIWFFHNRKYVIPPLSWLKIAIPSNLNLPNSKNSAFIIMSSQGGLIST
jgi:hypothetical protein